MVLNGQITRHREAELTFPWKENFFFFKWKYAVRSDRFLPFVFTPTCRLIFPNDSTLFPPKDKKITVIHLWHFNSIIWTKHLRPSATSVAHEHFFCFVFSQHCIYGGFNSCLSKFLRASGGCVPLNISWATRLVEREVMWRVKTEWLQGRKEERGDSRWWWTRAELWKNHDDRSRLSPVSLFLPATSTEWFCQKQLDSHKSPATFIHLRSLIDWELGLHAHIILCLTWSYKISHAHTFISVIEQNIWLE